MLSKLLLGNSNEVTSDHIAPKTKLSASSRSHFSPEM